MKRVFTAFFSNIFSICLQYGRQNIERQRKMTHAYDEIIAHNNDSIGLAYQKSKKSIDDIKLSDKLDANKLHDDNDMSDAQTPDTPDTSSNGNLANGNSVISRDALILLPEGGRISSASSIDNGTIKKSIDGNNESEIDVRFCFYYHNN